MGKVVSGITTSIDGYITGPNDGPGAGLGEGGERLHYWVFGGPWSYGQQPGGGGEGGTGEAVGADKEYLDLAFANMGAVIGGRWTYEAADHWGDENPWSVPFFVVTHRPDEQPAKGGFTFVGSFDEALERARAAAGDREVQIMGGASLIRQALKAGVVEEFALTISPVVLGRGKRLFDGFDMDLEFEQVRTWTSPLATHILYRLKR